MKLKNTAICRNYAVEGGFSSTNHADFTDGNVFIRAIRGREPDIPVRGPSIGCGIASLWPYLAITLHVGVLAGLLITSQTAQAQYTYTTNADGDSITITGYTGYGGAVTIPTNINNLPVTSIGDEAFAGTSVTSVAMPGSVTNIGEDAFDYCFYMTSVTIGDNVASIGDGAFYDCTSLTSVTVPKSVTSIGDQTFEGCTSVTSITVDASNPAYSSLGGVLFDKAQATLLQFPGGLGGSYTVPSSVTSIGDGAFVACSSLTGVTIPDSVTSISGYAFDSCTSLANVTIGTNVTSIGDYAFYDCTRLASVTIPNSVTSIGDQAFALCFSLTSVTIGINVASIGDYAFNSCFSLTNATIPNSVTSIGDYAFLGSGLTSVTIGINVASIGDYAFNSCFSLTSVTIPNSVTNIGVDSFGSSVSLTAITVAAQNPAYSSVNGVLFDKSQATLLQFPGGLGGSYTIPSSVTSIGGYAFDTCTSLTGVTIPNSVTSIGEYAFYESASLLSVTMPDSVTNIGGYAFYDCLDLVFAVIPNSVTSIGNGAFSACQSLTNVTIGTNVNSLGIAMFASCTSLASVTIPNSVTSIGEFAFGQCFSLTSVTIPNSVTNVGPFAFLDCTALTSAYFLGNAPPDVGTAFMGDTATVYHLAGTTGWGSTFGSRPTVLWNPQAIAAGVSAGQFRFNITGPTNATVVVEACINLSDPVWVPVSTNTLTGGSSSFSDPQWTSYTARFYGFGIP
jgi:hypothetical protein